MIFYISCFLIYHATTGDRLPVKYIGLTKIMYMWHGPRFQPLSILHFLVSHELLHARTMMEFCLDESVSPIPSKRWDHCGLKAEVFVCIVFAMKSWCLRLCSFTSKNACAGSLVPLSNTCNTPKITNKSQTSAYQIRFLHSDVSSKLCLDPSSGQAVYYA